jgi:hypothetical protein
MEKPTNLTFTDFEVQTDKLFRRSLSGPMKKSWTRTQFQLPDTFEAAKEVENWLMENTPGKWAYYTYKNPKGKADGHIMVVRFEDKNDALMFKLRGGHQAWETK